MSRFSSYKTTLDRFRTIGVEQDEYKQSYLMFSEFLVSLKDTKVDYSYFPTQQYKEEAQKYDSMIKMLLTDYATTLEYELEHVPVNMAADLQKIADIIAPAVDAADRLSKGEESLQDVRVIVSLLGKASAFAEQYGILCESIIENLKTFRENKLDELGKDMENLIATISGSSSTYAEQKEALQKQIDILNEIVKNKTNGAVSIGVGVGVFIVLGAASVIATVATGGGAAPAMVILAAVGVPCMVGLATLGVFCYQAEMAQKQIKEITAGMTNCDVSIAQLDVYGETYSGFVAQIDSVSEAVGTMKEEWDRLSEELKELSSIVESSSDSMNAREWAELADILKGMDAAVAELEKEIDKVRIDETVVSKGSYNFDMTEEEMQKECEEAGQVSLMRYLLTA